MWTIDRDRDVFLIRLGRGALSQHFALSWRKKVVKFKAFEEGYGSKVTGIVMSWKVFDISIPQTLGTKSGKS